MRVWKKSPKMWPNSFFGKINAKPLSWIKSSPKILPTSVIFVQLPKVNSRSMGENSPNPVTLVAATKMIFRRNYSFA
jgi:hypothetical protein